MLKCLDRRSGAEIIILDRQWKNKLSVLRTLDQQDQLVCPGCRQPVRVRAGKYKCWHFAHKHLQNCPFDRDSPQRVETRAFLYNWLTSQFPLEMVTVEKYLEESPLRHPVDCWVDQASQSLGYWIFDKRTPPADRENLKQAFMTPGLRGNYIFTIDLLRKDDLEQAHLHLTTTEREFLISSPYDELISGYIFSPGKSIHYLSSDLGELTTYRDLHLIHPPQKYAGFRLASTLQSVTASLETGEFIHPGEQDALRERQYVKNLREEKQRTTLPAFLTKKYPLNSSAQKLSNLVQSQAIPKEAFGKPGICKLCGKETADWVTFDGKTGKCICRDCASNH